MVKQISTKQNLVDALKEAQNKLVVVDFFATWCGPCLRIAPEIQSLSESMPEVVFLKVDVDSSEDVSSEYGIKAMPTFIFFKNGSQVDKTTGADIESIKKKISLYK